MEDSAIVDLYFRRSENAILETDKKYGRYCRFIAYNILENNEDASEILNDTYLKTWNTIPPNRPDPLKPYVGMISRQLSIDKYEKNIAKKRGGNVEIIAEELSECIPDGKEDADIEDGIGLKIALNKFVGSLPKKTQKVFVRRYWYSSSVAEIAKDFGMKESNVTVLLMRTRNKLKKYLKDEGFDI